MKLGWPTTRTMFRTGGWISCTVGGSETLVKSILASWPQPGAARAARSQNTSRRQPAERSETVGQRARRIRDLQARGRCLPERSPRPAETLHRGSEGASVSVRCVAASGSSDRGEAVVRRRRRRRGPVVACG